MGTARKLVFLLPQSLKITHKNISIEEEYMKRWTKEEIEYLKNEYSKIDGKTTTNIIEKVSKHLNRSKGSVRDKAYHLKITYRSKYYTKEEIMFLKDNIDKYTFRDMGKILKKETNNVYRKCKELNIKKVGANKSKIDLPPKREYSEEERQDISDFWKQYHKEHEHPKGMLNKHHSVKSKQSISEANKKSWGNMTKEKLKTRNTKQRQTRIKNNTLNPMLNRSNPYSRTKSGKREDLNNIFFRSSWEANIARYYNYLGIKWQFEPKTFIFDTIKKGCVSYLPDFYLPEEDKWVEVKGWMDKKSITKLNRFKKYYPEEYKKLELIDSKKYYEIQKKVSHFIANWE